MKPIPPRGKEQLGSADALKRWTDYDQRILDDACETGRLPDGAFATQERLRKLLGFSRQTIIVRLKGRKLPLCKEVMREAGRRGGVRAAYQRTVARLQTMMPAGRVTS